jgi:hypothetical protein
MLMRPQPHTVPYIYFFLLYTSIPSVSPYGYHLVP